QQSDMMVEWLEELTASGGRRDDLITVDDMKQQMRDILARLSTGMSGGSLDPNASAWESVREQLASMSRTRARQGFSPRETALAVFSLKKPFFKRLRAALASDPAALAEATW